MFSEFGNNLYAGKTSFDFVGKRHLWFIIAGVLVALSLILIPIKGINAGIDFTGGSQFTISNASTLEQAPAVQAVSAVESSEAPRVTSVGSTSLRVQTSKLTDEQTAQVRQNLAEAYNVPTDDVTATFIGPTWGKDISGKAIQSLVIFIVLIMVILMIYFRTWTMAAGAFVALLHDLIVTAGIYGLIGFEVTPATVIGLLTILGYSLYDTVVVFDKVRENTQTIVDQSRYTYAESANLAMNQTLIRSINTSVTGLLPVASVLFLGAFLLGAGTLRDISLALFVGMILSTLSSVFIAAPLAVELQQRNPRVREHTEHVLSRRAAALAEESEGNDDKVAVTASAPALKASDLKTDARPVEAGYHRGHTAQPKRKKSKKKKGKK